MKGRPTLPVALTLGGSDSGGGAGIQADLKTFAALGVHGTSVITCVTAQNPKRVTHIQACHPKTVRKQIEAIFEEMPPAAAKTGMLFSGTVIDVVAEFLQARQRPPLVVDPVMVATSGGRLLQPRALRALEKILPFAALVTPNIDEAKVLTALEIRSEEDLRKAARCLQSRFGCAALVKGGHLRGSRQAVDLFFDGKTELLLCAPFIEGVATHGTGCVYSAAITAFLALGHDLPGAVRHSKDFVTQTIRHGYFASGHFVLNSLRQSRRSR